jgi:signal transduction histidine kinase
LRTCLERIDRQTAAITRIVEDIGEASRRAHRKVSIEREQLDLRTVLREVLEECQVRLNGAKLVARCKMPESPVIVSADQVRLRQIFEQPAIERDQIQRAGGSDHCSPEG